MHLTFQPSRHSYTEYGDQGQNSNYRGSLIYRFYEKETAKALFRALGIDTRKKDGDTRNWDVLLLAKDKENPSFATLLAWSTSADLVGKVFKKLPWKMVDSVKSTASWEKEDAEYDVAQAYYDLRYNVSGRTSSGEEEKEEEPSPVSSDAKSDEDKNGDSSFPWLPVIGGSVLVLGLGVGGYLYYKSRKTT